MRSTFMGLEASRRAIFVQQTNLYTTGHNMANANNANYSRQRVNNAPTTPYPGVGLNAPSVPGYIGTGVESSSVQRVRDRFSDVQFRQEANNLGYWSAQSKAIQQVEDVLAEPSEFGLDQAFNHFWKAIEDVTAHPESTASRKVMAERGVELAESFAYMHKNILQIQQNLKNELNVSKDRVNALLTQIGDLNDQIVRVEPNGYLPNDLYDKRDELLDELNDYLPIDVSYEKSGGKALAIAEGAVTIHLKTAKAGETLTLVKGRDVSQLALEGFKPGIGFDDFKSFQFSSVGKATGGSLQHAGNDPFKGKLFSMINQYGYAQTRQEADPSDPGKTIDVVETLGTIPSVLAKLDRMANAFAVEFNKLHKEGADLTGAPGVDFFVPPAPDAATGKTPPFSAATLKVSEAIVGDPKKIAASSLQGAAVGNNQNALKLMNFKTTALEGLSGATVQSFYQEMIGQIGVDGERAARLQKGSETLQLSIANARSSFNSVSMDEEITNMIMFQQAYNASARMITVVDETIDRIINNMGRVGL